MEESERKVEQKTNVSSKRSIRFRVVVAVVVVIVIGFIGIVIVYLQPPKVGAGRSPELLEERREQAKLVEAQRRAEEARRQRGLLAEAERKAEAEREAEARRKAEAEKKRRAEETQRQRESAAEAQRKAEAESEAAAPLPQYPWPPEDPSSLVRLDQRYPSIKGAASLFEVAEIISLALDTAKYSQVSFFSAPGGFVMVTRLEGIDKNGAPLGVRRRHLLPDDQRDFSFVEYVRSLFFAPEGYYRFIAFVISDVPYTTKDKALSETTAVERLRRGATALPRKYRFLPFTPDHRIDALIYEFRKGGRDRDVEILRPGRLSPHVHLENSGLLAALNAAFQ